MRSQLEIPTSADWGDYESDLDVAYAYSQFGGRSNEEMQPAFRKNCLERVSDIRFMPRVPFQYYILGYACYVRHMPHYDPVHAMAHLYDGCDAASAFLDLVSEVVKDRLDWIEPIIEELLTVVSYVSSRQESYDADEDIYGSFEEIGAKIRKTVAGRRPNQES